MVAQSASHIIPIRKTLKRPRCGLVVLYWAIDQPGRTEETAGGLYQQRNMWLLRRGTLHGLIRFRGVAEAALEQECCAATLPSSSISSEQPESSQHCVRQTSGQGMWSSKALRQPHVQASIAGWVTTQSSTLLPLALSGAARHYCAAPCSTSSSNDTSTDPISSDSGIGSSSKRSQHKMVGSPSHTFLMYPCILCSQWLGLLPLWASCVLNGFEQHHWSKVHSRSLLLHVVQMSG